MLKNRFSAALIAFVVAAAPTAAFASTAVQEMTQDDALLLLEEQMLEGQQEGEGILLEPGVPGEESVDVTEQEPVNEEPGDTGQPGEAEEPTGEQPPVDDEIVPGDPQQELISEEPVAEEEIISEEPLEEELIEEEIIVEPVAATLTIVQRLIVDGEIDDFIQVIDGLEVGQIVSLADYIVDEEFVIYTGEITEITLSEENSEVILEYTLSNVYEFENLEK